MSKSKRKWIQLDWSKTGVLRAQDIPYNDIMSIKTAIDQSIIDSNGIYSETVTTFTLSGGDYYANLNHNLDTVHILTEFYLTSTAKKIAPKEVEIIDVDNIKIWFDVDPSSIDANVSSGGGSGISVKESSGSAIPITTLEFDQDTGFIVTDEGNDTAKVSLGSHWKDIIVEGQNTLTPEGEETLKIAAGEGISITTDATSSIQTLTITSDSTSSSVDLSSVDQDIIPATDSTYDLGTTAKRWKTLWADDVQVTGSSIYINGKKVLEDVSDTITVTTSVDQDLKVRTSGTGDTFIESENEVNINAEGGVEVNVPSTNPTKHINYTNQSTNGNLTFTTTGAGGQVQFSSLDEIDITAPVIDLNGTVNAGTNTITCGDPTADTHVATKGWTETSVVNNTVAATINDISNPGGNVDIVGGNNVTVTANDTTDDITIDADDTVAATINDISNPGGNINIVGGDNVIITANDTTSIITIDVPPLLNIRVADSSSSIIVSTDVQDLEFDSVSGFSVVDKGNGTAKVSFSVTSGFIEHFEYTDLVDGILTVSHNLDNKYVLTSIYDSTSSIVVCPVTLVDSDTLELDLSSLDTFTGSWSCIVSTPGTVSSTSSSGVVSYFAAEDPPSGYLECDGSEISRITYDKLFDTIGTTYGEGNGSTTFLVPDLRGEFIRGWDNGRGVDTGRVLGSYQADANKYHRHSMLPIWSNNAGGDLRYKMEANRGTQTRYTDYQGNNNDGRPKNKAMLACIKY